MSGPDVRPLTAKKNESLLVNRCLHEDSVAWETVVRSYGTRIRRMAYRYRHLRNDAEDVAQEVFFRVFRNLATFRVDSGSLENWVVRVGRNFLIDHFRASRRFRQIGGSRELEELNLKDEQCLPPDRSVEAAEASDAIMTSLQFLQPELKEAVVLRYLEGMTYQEMAEYLGVPQGTVKSRISRGRSKLASSLSCRVMKARSKRAVACRVF
jgi:RNA polymerase sigma-70 factor (ECF subfamily)